MTQSSLIIWGSTSSFTPTLLYFVDICKDEALKERLGTVWPGKENETLDIEGTLSLTGSRVRMTISTEDIVGVFEKPLQKLLLTISSAIKKIPLDCVNDIFENGIVLTGGAAELFGLDTMISKVLGISVTKPQNAIDAVARGLSRIHTFLPDKKNIFGKNITSQLARFYNAKKQNKK